MNAQISTPSLSLSAADVTRLSAAYGDSDATMAARVAVVRRLAGAGNTVKAMAADMAAAKTEDPTVNAYSAAIYGYALAASDAIDASGVAFNTTTTAQRATLHRAARHVGVKSLRESVKLVLSPLEDTVLAPERLALIVDAAAVALTTVRSDRAKTREPRPNTGEVTELDADEIDGEPVGPARIITDPATGALASIRDAVKFLQGGGELTRDMESAIAELTSAATAARKRTRILQSA